MDDHTPSEPTWERVEEVFTAACDIDDTAERLEFVRQACAGDEELRVEIERLLEMRDTDSQFLEPPPLVAADLAGRVIDDFEVIEEIGRGGMGVVYRAKQRSLPREVALKVLPLVLRGNDAVSERFRREAIAASKLRHPGIAQVLAFGEVDGTFYFAMELVEGTSLRDAMDRAFRGERAEHDPDLDDSSVCAELVRQMAEALHFAHEEGVVHRDVKPHNILIERDGRPRLIDFGLAKLLDMRGVTLTGDVNGTPHYMSPEQADATRRPIDRRADVYSLGAVLYELLSKRTPFLGASSYEVLYRIANDEPKALRKVAPNAPRELEVLCGRALERDPDDRLPSASVLADELARFVAGEPIRSAPRSAVERVQRKVVRSRRGIQIAVATALVVALLAFVLWPNGELGPKFTARFEGPPGTTIHVEILRLPLGSESEEVIESFDFTDEATIEIPIGFYRVRASDNETEWARSAYSETPSYVQLIDLRAGARVPDEGLVRVPAQSVTVWHFESRVGSSIPGTGRSVQTTDPFLVDPNLLTFARALEAIEAQQGAEVAQAFWDKRLKVFEGDPAFDENYLLSLPATYLDFDLAQNCLAHFGLRLPTMAEAVALARGGQEWLVGPLIDPDATPFNIGATDVEGPFPGIDDHYRYAEPVFEGAPLGPLGLRHPLGNVTIWTSSPAKYLDAEGQVVGLGNPSTFGLGWFDQISNIKFDEPDLIGGYGRGTGYVTTGVRGVRSLP